ncbi:hypothetical protein [Myroides odoratimimus]|uniref:hypothetical protein n=1 Tax=Myroides odoratimimus TaxID=76832 RepID=UPI002578EA9F|nr:hypothetical protein [Myroides odoratimimus]MDM1328107.1 hypothetical protein [Myroides odoratimimus]
MVILIIIAVAIFLWWSLVPSNKNTIKSSYSNSGNDDLKKLLFNDKYKYLISNFLAFPDAEVIESKIDSIRISSWTPRVRTTFFIIESFGYYTVYWEHKSQTFGKHSLNWQFPINHSQVAALEKIGDEISDYENKLLNNRYK